MKKDRKTILIVMIVVILFPILIKIFLSSRISEKEWFGFLGNYIGGAIGGIGAIISVLYTIDYYEKQNRKAYKHIENSLVIQKLDIIINNLINREPIPESLFIYDREMESVSKRLIRYNSLVSDFSAYYTNIAIDIFKGLFYLDDFEHGDYINDLNSYLNLPEEVKEYAFIVGKLALHENGSELIKAHPKLGHIIEKEAGGSWGLWHIYLHEFPYDQREKHKELEELFLISRELLLDIYQIKLFLQ